MFQIWRQGDVRSLDFEFFIITKITFVNTSPTGLQIIYYLREEASLVC